MRSHHGHSLKVAVACALGTLLAGCASGPPPQTTADLSRAHTLVAEADRSGAQEYAAADLQKARDEAQQADQLAGHGDAERADWLANEAAVDAQLADARAADGKSQHDLKDQRRTLETLRREENRQLQAPPAGASPSDTSPNGAEQPNQLQAVPPPPSTSNPPNSFP